MIDWGRLLKLVMFQKITVIIILISFNLDDLHRSNKCLSGFVILDVVNPWPDKEIPWQEELMEAFCRTAAVWLLIGLVWFRRWFHVYLDFETR